MEGGDDGVAANVRRGDGVEDDALWDLEVAEVGALGVERRRASSVRYWGYYSNVARGKRRAAARCLAAGVDPNDDGLCNAVVATLTGTTADEPFRRRARLTWEALQACLRDRHHVIVLPACDGYDSRKGNSCPSISSTAAARCLTPH